MQAGSERGCAGRQRADIGQGANAAVAFTASRSLPSQSFAYVERLLFVCAAVESLPHSPKFPWLADMVACCVWQMLHALLGEEVGSQLQKRGVRAAVEALVAGTGAEFWRQETLLVGSAPMCTWQAVHVELG